MSSDNVDVPDQTSGIRDELITLLEQVVALIASHTILDLQETLKVRVFLKINNMLIISQVPYNHSLTLRDSPRCRTSYCGNNPRE
jgi:hypothetical protein